MFEIKLIFLRSKSYVAIFSICMDANNFLLLDATDRSKISGDQKRFFIALSLYPLSFFANIPFKSEEMNRMNTCVSLVLGTPKNQYSW